MEALGGLDSAGFERAPCTEPLRKDSEFGASVAGPQVSEALKGAALPPTPCSDMSSQPSPPGTMLLAPPTGSSARWT